MSKWLRRIGGGFALVFLLIAVGWLLIGRDWRALLVNPPLGTEVLFWSQAQRDAGFRMLDRLPIIKQSRAIAAGQAVYALPVGEPL